MNTLFIEREIEGCIQWIQQYRDKGWIAYYVNIMFERLDGTTTEILEQMRDAIYREFYKPFMLKFVRDPHRRAEQEWMPQLKLYPDLPMLRQKRRKTSIREVKINGGGLHYNGFLLIPPVSRFWGDPVELIQESHSLYCRHRIDRIHPEYVNDDVRRVVEYATKTIAEGRAELDDMLVLPRSLAEVKRANSPIAPEQKSIKDIVSAYNVSEEQARQMYQAQQRTTA